MRASEGTPEGVIVTTGRVSMEHPSIVQTSSKDFIVEALGGPLPHFISRTRWDRVADKHNWFLHYGDAVPASLMLQATHEAFSQHVGLTIAPETAWYMIVHEVAICVKNSPIKYAHLFTDKPGEKQIMRIIDDSLRYGSADNDWGSTIELFRKPLHEKLSPNTANLFLPKFSTLTPESEVALILALMDSASPYYDYRVMTRCGIPAVRITGTVEDWEKVVAHAIDMAVAVPELQPYFTDLISVLKTIRDTVAIGAIDPDFWCSVYKYNDQSGAPRVTGWLAAFTAYLQTKEGPVMKEKFNWRELHKSDYYGQYTNTFPAHVSKIPFIWEYRVGGAKDIPMVFSAGVYGVEYQSEFLTPQLGFGVFEPKTA
jgi:hypothetical protein